MYEWVCVRVRVRVRVRVHVRVCVFVCVCILYLYVVFVPNTLRKEEGTSWVTCSLETVLPIEKLGVLQWNI